MEHAVLARLARPAAGGTAARRAPVAFWLVAFALVAVIMGNNAPSPIYPIFQERFGFSTGELTVVFAAVVAGVVPALLFLGPLSDRVGRRPLLLVALVLALAGSLGFAAASGLDGLLAARVLQGLAFGALSGTAAAALAELEPHGDHARAALATTVAIVGAQAVSPLAAGLLAQYAPDPARLTFLLLGGLLVVAIAGLVAVPETVSRTGAARRGPGSLAVPAGIRAPFAVAALAVTAAFGALGLISALGPKFVTSLLHVDNRAVGGAVVFAMLGASAAAQLTARGWHVRRQLVGGAVILAVGLGLLLAGVAARSLAVFLVAVPVAGLGQGAAYLGAQELLDRIVPPDHRAGVMSAFFLVLYLAAAAVALAVGLGAGLVGLRSATVVGAGALALVSLASAELSASSSETRG